ncbi:hypothetical protein OI25_7217 [Paraburkholderia fungorum]|jgi:hypothetical protein|uniref:Uncharacterized protein n=1 Tax=Paraburkholderia fungorum TaxID=134537 RepID=A0AAP5UZX3_9BURK|nr:hypothetical protein [Paraburkholderia fungorum]AJZ56797.1 hypothetical protein OI25_7217 [Paraburkholderia fungorum]MDT8842639.1 hypothetical protein [Paraburkholderia fungorum]PRZ49201.1 hypothetical protein BX589_126110 [Paraburkholderia fungorum]
MPLIASAQSPADSDKIVVMRDGESVLMLPAVFEPQQTYMVVQRHGDVAVVPYSDAKDCARFAKQLGGSCLSGVDAMKRFNAR